MKLFNCTHCGNRVFFENQRCEACGSTLGFSTEELAMVAFQVSPDGGWSRCGEGLAYRPCSNTAEGVCNWLVPVDSDHPLCVSCRTTHTIPALGKPENRAYWGRLEQAKRRLFFTLLELGLPMPSKAADAANGLSFEFLEEMSQEVRVLTGHDEGVITLNIAEADDARREQIRLSMHEPYRTLLGHFRHEIGHYYWDRLIRNTTWIDEYRALFGDESVDYAQALQQHYAQPPQDWQQRFISVYASAHSWEDWAETWAHYMHMFDGLATAAAWGLHLDQALPGGPALTALPIDPDADSIRATVIEQWLPVSQFINAMDRSLGANDSYPFIVVESVVAKLDFVHRVIRAARRGDVPMNFAAAGATPADLAPGDLAPTQPHDLPPQDAPSPDMQPQGVQPQDLQPQNVQPQDVQVQDVQPQDVQVQGAAALPDSAPRQDIPSPAPVTT